MMQEGYKQTELGMIPDDWKIKKLSNFSDFFSGGTPKSDNKLFYGGEIPFIKSGEIHSTYTEQYLTAEGFKNSSAKLVKKGDILYALYGANSGDVSISKIDGAINQAIVCIRPNSNIYYIKSFLEINKSNIINKYLQGGQGNLSTFIIKNLSAPLPSIDEQNAIADCLTTWDDVIEKQTQLIKAKEERHKALMQQLLSGKKRLPSFTEEWKEYKYSELVKEVKRKEIWDDTKLYELISVKRRSGGVFHRDSLYGYQIEVKALVKIKENDFLISKMQIVHGASSIVNKEFENFYVSGSYIILNVKNEKVLNPKFINLFSKQKYFYYQTFVSSYGVHIEKMTFDFKTFLKTTAFIPSISEQNSIVEIIETSENELSLEKQKLNQLKEQKKALMQKLLIGKVRLPFAS